MAFKSYPRWLRTGDPPPVEAPQQTTGIDDDDAGQDDRDEHMPDTSELEAFEEAVRHKEHWALKMVQQTGLIEKWAREAKLPDHTLVNALLQGLSLEARRIYAHDHAIHLTSKHLPERAIDYDVIKVAVDQADHYLRTSQYGIDSPKLWEKVGACFADNVVPQVLYDELVRELDALAVLGLRDLHPGSGGKVHDVIHPSLYPFTADNTPLPASVQQPPTERGEFVSEMEEKHEYQDEKVTLSSAYAWIPTVFAVSDDGQDISIDSYINGLGKREQYPTLFRLLELAFKIVMPMLESSATFEFDHHSADTGPYRRYSQRKDYHCSDEKNKEGYLQLLKEQERGKEEQRGNEALAAKRKEKQKHSEKEAYAMGEHTHVQASTSIWAGNKLKVIVKAANYILEPGHEYSGSWHIEGMPHECIVASAIYYYERDPSIVDAGLYLRRKRDDNEDWPGIGSATRDDFYVYVEGKGRNHDDDRGEGNDESIEGSNVPSDFGDAVEDMPAYFNVGVLPTTGENEKQGTGRIITFPNWLQHRVHSIYNHPDAKQAATRKILCFFLVDDTDPSDELDFPGFKYVGLESNYVLTTSEVPSQERACNLPTLELLLPVAVRQLTHGHRNLPPEIVEVILAEAVKDDGLGLSRAEAEKRRRELMKDRKVNAEEIDGLWQAEYSLCEH